MLLQTNSFTSIILNNLSSEMELFTLQIVVSRVHLTISSYKLSSSYSRVFWFSLYISTIASIMKMLCSQKNSIFQLS